MAFDKKGLDSYIQVNERIIRFYEKFPEGSLQSEIIALEKDRVVMKAFAYRMPNDERPGIGYSSLQIPGPTPYTKNSEIENAETSAWGRALAALGFEVKRGVASRDEIENKADGGKEVEAEGGTAARRPQRTDEDIQAGFDTANSTEPRPLNDAESKVMAGLFADLFEHTGNNDTAVKWLAAWGMRDRGEPYVMVSDVQRNEKFEDRCNGIRREIAKAGK